MSQGRRKKRLRALRMKSGIYIRYMERKVVDWMDQVLLAMDRVGGASYELDLLQAGVGNSRTFTGICEYYMGTYDVLRELLDSDL